MSHWENSNLGKQQMEINENEKPQMAIEDDSTSRKKRLKTVVIVRRTSST